MSDHYSILGISRNATPEQVKAAFRRLAKQKHPDILPPTVDRETANEAFASIVVAYKTLRDTDSRRVYDHKLVNGLISKDDVKKNHARATFKLGMDCYKDQYYRRSYRYFQACCRLDPENPYYWSYLGLAAVSSGRPLEEAVAWGEKAIELHPSSPQYHINLGLIYQKVQKKSEAKKAFKAALKLDPYNSLARKFLGK